MATELAHVSRSPIDKVALPRSSASVTLRQRPDRHVLAESSLRRSTRLRFALALVLVAVWVLSIGEAAQPASLDTSRQGERLHRDSLGFGASDDSLIRQLGTASDDDAAGVAADGAGNTYVGGSTGGSLGGPSAGLSDGWLAKYAPDGALLWTRQLGTPENDWAFDVAADGAGNAYLAGSTRGSLGGPLAGTGVSDAWVAKYAPDGTLLWTRQLGTAATDIAAEVAPDGTGNAYVVGLTQGSLGGPAAGSMDGWVAKYGPDGALLWTRQLGTASTDVAQGLAVDGSGNAYVGGLTGGSLGGPSAGSNDAWVAKYAPDGVLVWTRQFGTAAHDAATGVGADASGNVYIVGDTQGSLGGPSTGSDDAWVAKYAADGALLWTRQLGTAATDLAGDVAADASGNAYIAGYTDGSLGGPSAGGSDAWMAKYAADGALLWTRQLGTAATDTASDIDADASGNAIIVGYTDGSLGGPSAGGSDAWVLRVRSTTALELVDDLIALVRTIDASHKSEQKLALRLEAVRRELVAGKKKPACVDLRVFVDQVENHVRKGWLTSQDAAKLTSAARALALEIDC